MNLAILFVGLLVFSAFTYKNNKEETALKAMDCKDGYAEVSWSVSCPNGITYSGARCFRNEHALQAAETILNAPCPD